VYEKLIEHWLTSVNELGFQLPLCEALLAEGYTILHVSRHGRGEHGKDIIARDPAGALTTFQLKGGDITLGKWQDIRGEVEDLVQLPVMLPGVDASEPHQPFLVTNGELRGDATISIREYAEVWKAKGFGFLGVWQKHELLQKFIEAHGTYVPSGSLRDFRSFVELYVADFRDRLPREQFTTFVFDLYPSAGGNEKTSHRKRALESAILTGEYVVAQYENAANHLAALEGWTVLAVLILYAAERDALPPEAYLTSLKLIRTAFQRNAERFSAEVTASENFLSPLSMLAEDPEVRGARTVLILGWLATLCLNNAILDQGINAGDATAIVSRELPNLFFSTEADWPYVVGIALMLGRTAGSSHAEGLLNRWIETVLGYNRGQKAEGIPSPYWLQEAALSLRYGKIPPGDREDFSDHSYTIHAALDMLVRRLRRQAVRGYWKRVSKLVHCDFLPDARADWFLWRSDKGDSRMALFPLSKSWGEWRNEVSSVNGDLIPRMLLDHPEWVMPFALVFPHRMNRLLTAMIDARFGGHAEMSVN
jgi:hypothetical protein